MSNWETCRQGKWRPQEGRRHESEQLPIELAIHSELPCPDMSRSGRVKHRIAGSLTPMNDNSGQGKLDLGDQPWHARGEQSMSRDRESADMATPMPFPSKRNCRFQRVHTKYVCLSAPSFGTAREVKVFVRLGHVRVWNPKPIAHGPLIPR
jgi:hypothetical protein